MKFSKKTAHRIIVSLAMLAPVVYLFGAMFFGLAGAHGNQLWAQEEQQESIRITPNFSQEWINVDSGTVSYPNGGYTSEYFEVEQGLVYHSVIPSDYVVVSLRGLFYDSDFVFLSGYSVNEPSFDVLINVPSNASYFRVGYASSISSPPSSTYIEVFYPVGSTVVDSVNYSDFLFGQFFPHDNFLERMGVNALSANPIGFAPFGTFLSYLDVNVFHASGSQVALMLYGMVYWSLHVIIADLVYHVAVFIPNIIQRVFDWFGQKGLEDD